MKKTARCSHTGSRGRGKTGVQVVGAFAGTGLTTVISDFKVLLMCRFILSQLGMADPTQRTSQEMDWSHAAKPNIDITMGHRYSTRREPASPKVTVILAYFPKMMPSFVLPQSTAAQQREDQSRRSRGHSWRGHELLVTDPGRI